MAFAASPAWPCVAQCIKDELSEVLVHPLWPVFNVGKHHTSRL
jgi:hypothetical protein